MTQISMNRPDAEKIEAESRSADKQDLARASEIADTLANDDELPDESRTALQDEWNALNMPDGVWIDPAGGVHEPDEDDPAWQYR